MKKRYDPRDPGYIDLARQQAFYELTTGDRERFLGFQRRFSEWCVKNTRESLRAA